MTLYSKVCGLDTRSLALFRILLALVVLGDVINRSYRDLRTHYSDEGTNITFVANFSQDWFPEA